MAVAARTGIGASARPDSPPPWLPSALRLTACVCAREFAVLDGKAPDRPATASHTHARTASPGRGAPPRSARTGLEWHGWARKRTANRAQASASANSSPSTSQTRRRLRSRCWAGLCPKDGSCRTPRGRLPRRPGAGAAARGTNAASAREGSQPQGHGLCARGHRFTGCEKSSRGGLVVGQKGQPREDERGAVPVRLRCCRGFTGRLCLRAAPHCPRRGLSTSPLRSLHRPHTHTPASGTSGACLSTGTCETTRPPRFPRGSSTGASAGTTGAR